LKNFVETITTSPDLVTTFVNASNRGMSVTLKKATPK